MRKVKMQRKRKIVSGGLLGQLTSLQKEFGSIPKRQKRKYYTKRR